jgi:hypothetical protein
MSFAHEEISLLEESTVGIKYDLHSCRLTSCAKPFALVFDIHFRSLSWEQGKTQSPKLLNCYDPTGDPVSGEERDDGDFFGFLPHTK